MKNCRSNLENYLSLLTIVEDTFQVGKNIYLCIVLSDEEFSYSSRRKINVPSDCVDYYKEVLPAKFHDRIVELEPAKNTKAKK